LLDEGYFMYFEDVDYCRRVRKAGWQIRCAPESKVTHHLGGSSHAGENGRKRLPRFYYESRARYYTKFYGRAGLWLANSLWCGGRCVALLRELAGNLEPTRITHEAYDIWIHAWMPPADGRTRRTVRPEHASN
jgi:GT2 family glycosyltransferase